MSNDIDSLTEGLVHAGAGTTQSVVLLSAVIPGFLPGLLLAGALTVVVAVPLLVAGLAAAVLATPPYLLWRLATRGRRRRAREGAHSAPTTT